MFPTKAPMAKSRLIIRLLFTVLLLGCRIATWAQPIGWKAFSIHDGLTSDCIMDMAQDRSGRIWIATSGGLNLYDGNRIRTFTRSRHPEAGSLIANDLNKVWPDPTEPVVWIATQRDGLDAYNYQTGVFTHHQANGQPGCIVDNSVTSISPSHSGGIWLTSYIGGISHYDRKTQRFTLINSKTHPSLVSDAMWCLLETDDSLLYTGHVRNGISCINLKTHQVKNIPVITCFKDKSPAEDGVRSMVKDDKGRLWLGTEKGLACLLPESDRLIPVPLIKGLVCHLYLSHHTLWISTRDMGLWALHLQQLDAGPLQASSFISPETITPVTLPCFGKGETALVRCALPDRSGNVWTGTDRKGIQVRLHEPQMFYNETLPSDIRVLELDSQGNLWTGTLSGGITITHPNGETQTYTTANSHLGNNSITALQHTPDGDMWIGNDMEGLYRWQHTDQRIHKIPLIDNEGGNTIFVQSIKLWNNRLAIGTYQGLFLVDPATETSTCYTDKNSPLPEQYISSLLTDRQGNLWCGSALNGLIVLSPDMKCLLKTDPSKGLPEKSITSMLESKDGSIWAATEDGLIHIRHKGYSSPRIEVLREENGLSHPTIQALAETAKGQLWCSTPDGLYIIKEKNNGEDHYAIPCYQAKGTNERAFRMNAALSLSSHCILWGGNGRLSVYTQPPTRGSLRKAYHAEILQNAEGDYMLAITITDIALSDKVEFKYQLDNGDWTDSGNTRNIPLGKLSGGKHSLKIMPYFIGSPGDDTSTKTLTFKVPRTRQFFALAGSILLLSIATGIFIRRKRTRKQAPEKQQPPVVQADEPAESQSTLSPASLQLLEKAEQITDSMMQEPDFDKNRLAQELCMSPSTLYRRLKPATGLSPNEYIRHRRLLRAKQLLTEGHTVSETAALVGMSVTYLGRCYKEEYGISPSDVRP